MGLYPQVDGYIPNLQLLRSRGQRTDYEVLNLLGEGSMGAVYKVRKKGQQQLMCWKQSCSTSSQHSEKRWEEEASILKQLNHGNIIQFIDCFKWREAGGHGIPKKTFYYIVMEFGCGGDLAKHISEWKKDPMAVVPVTLKLRMFWEIVDGLEYLHKLRPKLVHRDIKPANIILDSQKHAKIGDFGLSCWMHENEFKSDFCGTLMYSSPEIIKQRTYNEKTDVWSLGCLLYELLLFTQAFGKQYQTEAIVKLNIENAIYDCPKPHVSKTMHEMIKALLTKDGHIRPSMSFLKWRFKSTLQIEAAWCDFPTKQDTNDETRRLNMLNSSGRVREEPRHFTPPLRRPIPTPQCGAPHTRGLGPIGNFLAHQAQGQELPHIGHGNIELRAWGIQEHAAQLFKLPRAVSAPRLKVMARPPAHDDAPTRGAPLPRLPHSRIPPLAGAMLGDERRKNAHAHADDNKKLDAPRSSNSTTRGPRQERLAKVSSMPRLVPPHWEIDDHRRDRRERIEGDKYSTRKWGSGTGAVCGLPPWKPRDPKDVQRLGMLKRGGVNQGDKVEGIRHVHELVSIKETQRREEERRQERIKKNMRQKEEHKEQQSVFFDSLRKGIQRAASNIVAARDPARLFRRARDVEEIKRDFDRRKKGEKVTCPSRQQGGYLYAPLPRGGENQQHKQHQQQQEVEQQQQQQKPEVLQPEQVHQIYGAKEEDSVEKRNSIKDMLIQGKYRMRCEMIEQQALSRGDNAGNAKDLKIMVGNDNKEKEDKKNEKNNINNDPHDESSYHGGHMTVKLLEKRRRSEAQHKTFIDALEKEEKEMKARDAINNRWDTGDKGNIGQQKERAYEKEKKETEKGKKETERAYVCCWKDELKNAYGEERKALVDKKEMEVREMLKEQMDEKLKEVKVRRKAGELGERFLRAKRELEEMERKTLDFEALVEEKKRLEKENEELEKNKEKVRKAIEENKKLKKEKEEKERANARQEHGTQEQVNKDVETEMSASDNENGEPAAAGAPPSRDMESVKQTASSRVGVGGVAAAFGMKGENNLAPPSVAVSNLRRVARGGARCAQRKNFLEKILDNGPARGKGGGSMQRAEDDEETDCTRRPIAPEPRTNVMNRTPVMQTQMQTLSDENPQDGKNRGETKILDVQPEFLETHNARIKKMVICHDEAVDTALRGVKEDYVNALDYSLLRIMSLRQRIQRGGIDQNVTDSDTNEDRKHQGSNQNDGSELEKTVEAVEETVKGFPSRFKNRSDTSDLSKKTPSTDENRIEVEHDARSSKSCSSNETCKIEARQKSLFRFY